MIRKVIVVLAMSLGACSSPLKERFYTLDAAEPPAAAAGAPSVAVSSVSVPDLVDRPQIVVRMGPNQVGIGEQARWAEPLRSAIARVVAANLATALGGRVAPQRTGDADYRITIDVQRFESTPGDGVLIDTAWNVAPKSGERRAGRSVAREKVRGADYEALAAAHSAALAAISREIAAAIR
ncbi:MAG TPA: PqiC family protein [Burkholderiales bacterium]|nr:PqiC family protein [Burkholderiales bacterium]